MADTGRAIAEQFTEDVRGRSPIEVVVAKFTALDAKGKGLCPLPGHQEKTPSFYVYPDPDPREAHWYCHGCKNGGDVFALIMAIKGLPFFDAVKYLAIEFGVAIPEFGKRNEAVVRKETAAFAFLAECAAGFHEELLSGRHTEDLAWLHDRGITDAMIEKYQIGYGFKITKPELVRKAKAVGMIVRAKTGRDFNLMQNRITVPIRRNGVVRNFTARTRDQKSIDDGMKWIGLARTEFTPITPMCSENLRRPECAVVEGAFDLIISEEVGGVPTCATISTNFAAEWLKLIGKGTRIVLARDSDANEAGQKANLKNGRMLFDAGVTVDVMELPMGEDPDSFIRSNGQEAYQGLMRDAVTYVSYWIGRQPTKPVSHQLPKILDGAYELIGTLRRELWQPHVDELNKRYGIKKGALLDGISEWRKAHAETRRRGEDGRGETGQVSLGGDLGTRGHGDGEKKSDYQYPSPDDTRPVIYADNENTPQVCRQMWDAIAASNGPPGRDDEGRYRPWCFQQGGVPLRLKHDDRGVLKMQAWTVAVARNALGEIISWRGLRYPKGGGLPFDIMLRPPNVDFENLLAEKVMPLPILSRIVGTPVFGRDGSLQIEPGYHEASRTFYEPTPGVTIPPVDDAPTDQHVASALEIFEDLICDFPFVDTADKTHAFCMFLLPYLKEMIDGPTPMHDIEASAPGTGKSLLMNTLWRPAIGMQLGVITQPESEEEAKKLLLAMLVEGYAAIMIDNADRMFNSSVFAAALTERTFAGRILGRTETVQLPINCVWVMTSNNPQVSGQMARRMLPIRMVAKTADPEMRPDESFKHPNLEHYVEQNRDMIVWAALTLGRAWVSRGMPEYTGRMMGSYTAWSRVMGSICEMFGMEDFLGNLLRLYEQADPDRQDWKTFIAAWWTRFGGTAVLSKTLVDLAKEIDVLGLGTSHQGKEPDGKALGRKLLKRLDVVFNCGEEIGQFSMHKLSTKHSGAIQWFLEQEAAGIGDGSAPELAVMGDEGNPFEEE